MISEYQIFTLAESQTYFNIILNILFILGKFLAYLEDYYYKKIYFYKFLTIKTKK